MLYEPEAQQLQEKDNMTLRKQKQSTGESYLKSKSLVPAGLTNLGGSGWLLVEAKAPILVADVSSLVPLDPPTGCKLAWEVTER